MKKQVGLLVFLAMLPVVSSAACHRGGGMADEQETATTSESVAPEGAIRIVSTPNPSVFPLLLAIARDPELPVELLPVADSAGMNEAFASEEGEGLLAMTWVAAAKVESGVAADLTLVSVDFWRGFFELTTQGESVQHFSDLIGQNLLLSGPVSGAHDGGPDKLFQAALKREGFDPSIYTESNVTITINGEEAEVTRRHYVSGDFRVYYMPVMEASSVLTSGILLDDGDGDTANDMPAIASFMVEPAATGMTMNGMMQGSAIDKSIDIQETFSGYTAWPTTQLPLGGMSIRRSVLDDADRTEAVARLKEAYDQAAYDLANPSCMLDSMRMAMVISRGITNYYGQYGMILPAPVIVASIKKGDLVFRSDLAVSDIQADLENFHSEILGSVPPASFYTYP